MRLTLPAGVFGSSATNSTWRGYSCWLSRWRTRSWISLANASSPALGDDEGLDDLAAQRVGHADGGGFAHVGMLQHRVLDLDRAHRPAGRDDDVVGAAAVVEVAVVVGAAEVLGGDPAVAPPDLDLAGHAGRAGLAVGSCTSMRPPGIGLPSEPGFTAKSARAGIAHEDHADLGGAVHAAQRAGRSRLGEGRRLAVDRLAGEGQLLRGSSGNRCAAPEFRIIR